MASGRTWTEATLGAVRGLVAAGLLGGMAGCSHWQWTADYTPAGLPAFLHEDVPVVVAPPAPVTLCAGEVGCVNGCAPAEHTQSAPAEQRPLVLSLPEAIHECVFANLLVQAGTEKVQQARAGLLHASLIPNPTFYFDSILNPLPGSHFTPTRQGGPPQDDVIVTFPIDWLVFGKRVAAMEAKRLGVDVAAADLADLVRLRVTDTVIAFYDLLEAKQLLDIGRLDVKDAQRIDEITQRLVKAGELPPIETDRSRLLLLDAQRDLLRREAAVKVARAKLAPLLGRCSPVPQLDVRGELAIAVAAAPLDECEAIRIAEERRPDLVALRRRIDQAEAEILSERRKAFPAVTVQPWFTYQFQRQAIGFPDARSYGFALTSTLPFTDRNQGNIANAQSVQREAVLNLRAQLAAVRSEVKQAIDIYQAARQVAGTQDPAAIEAARRLRDKTEASFKKGQDSLLTLVLMQRAYLDRLRLSVSVKADYWRAVYRLSAAVGARADGCPPPAAPPPVLLGPPQG